MIEETTLEVEELLVFLIGYQSKLENSSRAMKELRRELKEGRLSALSRCLSRSEVKNAREELEGARSCGFSLLPFGSDEYPERLAAIDDFPLLLYVWGSVAALRESVCIGIVGARKCSDYGARHAFRLAAECRGAGAGMVSGLARGVDGAAHSGALGVSIDSAASAASPGVAVLGSGLLHLYPHEHKQLAEQLVDAGGAVVSEFPLRMSPTRYTFPMRNRIISGLSDAIVVVEASERSGALITARLALEQGREVFVVPGPVNTSQSRGIFKLLSDGAQPIETFQDLVKHMPQVEMRLASSLVGNSDAGGGRAVLGRVLEQFPEAKRACAEAIVEVLVRDGPCRLDYLIEKLAISSREISPLLVRLESAGIVSRRPGGVLALGGV